jgi:hypothetical protein
MADVLQEQWALDLAVRIEVMRRLATIRFRCLKHDGHSGPDTDATFLAVSGFLDQARAAVEQRTEGRFHGRRPLDRWRGISVVKAYENVHAAENFLVDLADDEHVRVLLPSVIGRADRVLDKDDPSRADVSRLRRLQPGQAIDRPCFKRVMRAGFFAEDQIYLRIRTFRNLLVKCTLMLFVLIAVMIALVATHPSSMPLCFAPGASAMPDVCPSGEHTRPSGQDICIVAGLGLLGSAAAAAFSVRRLQGIPTPYDIPLALGVFKLPLGAFTAVTGLLLLGGNFVPGLSQLDSQRQILAYALVFGYAQQLVSRLIDQQARTIVSRLPMSAPPPDPRER